MEHFPVQLLVVATLHALVAWQRLLPNCFLIGFSMFSVLLLLLCRIQLCHPHSRLCVCHDTQIACRLDDIAYTYCAYVCRIYDSPFVNCSPRTLCHAGLSSIACQLQPERERARERAAERERERIAKLIKSKKHVKPKSKFSEHDDKRVREKRKKMAMNFNENCIFKNRIRNKDNCRERGRERKRQMLGKHGN